MLLKCLSEVLYNQLEDTKKKKRKRKINSLLPFVSVCQDCQNKVLPMEYLRAQKCTVSVRSPRQAGYLRSWSMSESPFYHPPLTADNCSDNCADNCSLACRSITPIPAFPLAFFLQGHKSHRKRRWDSMTNSMDINLSKSWRYCEEQGSLVCCRLWGCKELDTI